VSWAELYVNSPARGSWNMSVDAGAAGALWKRRGDRSCDCTSGALATLSLGYFQKFDERALHPASAGLDSVRRRGDGGGRSCTIGS
jgi:hypothetical protein